MADKRFLVYTGEREMLHFTRSGWEIENNSKLAEIKRLAYKGELSQQIYLLCWQIVAYGKEYAEKIDSANSHHALSLLGL